MIFIAIIITAAIFCVNAIHQVFNDYEKRLKKDNEKNKLLAEAKDILAVANFEWSEDAWKADKLYDKIEKILT